MLARVNGRAMAVVTAVILLAATFFTFQAQPVTRSATAHFSRVVSIYKGSEVRILGVPIGTVTAVVPEGNSVRVDMTYDAQYKVPAHAKAVIVTPTLVSDRFVQLTPAYRAGPQLPDGADIAVKDTGTPVELDRIYASLRDLSNALGPNGVNRKGSLSTLLAAGTKTLKGEGSRGNRMINDLSQATQTFGDRSGELFKTISQLSDFTSVLAQNDQVVSSFIQDLAGVSGQLSGERPQLRAMLAALAQAVGRVQSFVHHNRNALSGTLKSLTSVVGAVAKERNGLALSLEKGPLGAGNLALAYDTPTGSIGGRITVNPNVDDPSGFLCAVVQNAPQIPQPDANTACKIFKALLQRLPHGQVPPGQGASANPLSGAPGLPKLGGGAPANSLHQLLGGGR